MAVKVLAPLPVSQAELRLRFFHEHEALSRIHHPNLVDIVEVVAEQPLGYVVMELLDGEELAQLIEREAPLSVDAAVDTLLPVAAALTAAHAAGAIHRALNPSNIFLSRVHDGSGTIQPKVLNLGISKIFGMARTMALGGGSDPPGTTTASSYLAPEQVRDSRVTDPRTDVYALATILYECLTGRRAFDGENQFATLRIISAGACPAARSWRPELPARLDAADHPGDEPGSGGALSVDEPAGDGAGRVRQPCRGGAVAPAVRPGGVAAHRRRNRPRNRPSPSRDRRPRPARPSCSRRRSRSSRRPRRSRRRCRRPRRAAR